ncbi:MAG: hypothetical protein J5486_02125, partial [Bacteroidaceae bacterium]|nr:hypothetical protein [Bacteroidaceae bacterium]
REQRQTYTVFGTVSQNTEVVPYDLGETKGFLVAVQHREILMTVLGLTNVSELLMMKTLFRISQICDGYASSRCAERLLPSKSNMLSLLG